jgi:hypothetical protein
MRWMARSIGGECTASAGASGTPAIAESEFHRKPKSNSSKPAGVRDSLYVVVRQSPNQFLHKTAKNAGRRRSKKFLEKSTDEL